MANFLFEKYGIDEDQLEEENHEEDYEQEESK